MPPKNKGAEVCQPGGDGPALWGHTVPGLAHVDCSVLLA